MRAAGVTQALTDTILNMNQRHLGAGAVTVYEALEDAGLVAAAVNITCYRGRHRHPPKVPIVARAAYGPSRFFYYSLFESDRTGAHFAVLNRGGGSVDLYAAEVGRWLVTRDGFDFLAYYLSDFDYASHAHGPAGAVEVALERTDAAVGVLFEAAGGPDEFLERYAVVLMSDHGQTDVERVARLQDSFRRLRDEVVVTASNRAGHVYLLPHARVDAAELARRLDGTAAVEVTLRREGEEAVGRRDGEELRFRPAAEGGVFPLGVAGLAGDAASTAPAGGWETSGDASLLDHPDALHRAWSALANPNAGELLVSAAEGWELADLGGRHHLGGGSHGSLVAGDSLVPLLTIGIDAEPQRITDVMPAILTHFGVRPPAYVR